MKNVHLIPTDKPSRLFYDISMDKLVLASTSEVSKWFENKNIYITSDEEIKEGDWCYQVEINDGKVDKCYDVTLYHTWTNNGVDKTRKFKKIILTTDQDLIKDSVQAIDDDFLEWFVKNPSCKEVEVEKICNNCGDIDCIHAICHSQIAKIKGDTHKIIIPKEEPKQETLEIDLTNLCYYNKRNPDCSVDDEDIEDHKKSLLKKNKTCSCDNCFYGRTELAEQLIWQQERSYSEVIEFAEWIRNNPYVWNYPDKLNDTRTTEELFEQFKKK